VSDSPNYPFTATANRTLVANFIRTYCIITSASPSEGGTTSGGGTYDSGGSVTATATENPGYRFVSWTEGGSAVSDSPNYPFTATAKRTLVANCEAIDFTCTLTSMGLNSGTFEFVLAGRVGSSYIIEMSRTLITWLPLSVHTIPASGSVLVTDPDTSRHSQRFYRAMLYRPSAVRAWGANLMGVTNVPTDLTNVIAISARGWHTLALKIDGTVTAWGAGTTDVGTVPGDDPNRGQSPVPSGLSNVVAVAGGYAHSLALKIDGTVIA
jgi:hypothetical protein